jgi:C1A family cysteine protease
MKQFFLSIAYLIITTGILAQPVPEKAPADTSYRISAEELGEMQDNGIILPLEKPAHDVYANFRYERLRDLPAVYDFRDSAWLTPVKSQSAGGCWAYSTMGAVEARLMMLGFGEYNLSDNNLKFCHGYIPPRNTNGNHWMSSAYFARSAGPYLETEDPYPGGTNSNDDCPTQFSPQFYIGQSRYPPQDAQYIKQTVLQYGPVWSLLYYNATYLNTANATYFYGGTHAVNHAGVIVGWNDTLTTAGGTGAWIVRNTYGASFGQGGYYYISYNDSQFTKYNGYWPQIQIFDPTATIRQYDNIGGYWGTGFGTSKGCGLVHFDGPEKATSLSQIGTFVVSATSSVTINVYDTFSDSLSGWLGAMQMQDIELPGYYTFDLDTTIFLPAGQDFYVEVCYNSNDPDDQWPIATEDTIAGYAMPQIETGRFWIAPDPDIWPTAWYPIGHNTSQPYDLCIKAITHDLYSLSGIMQYDDSLQSPAIGVSLSLRDATGRAVDSIITDSTGYYRFENLASGAYHLHVDSSENSFGNVNSTDALAVALHLIGNAAFQLSGAALAAADANADQTIDSLDVAAIQQHTVFMPGVIGNPLLVVDPSAITISAGDVIHNVKVRGRGDVNP